MWHEAQISKSIGCFTLEIDHEALSPRWIHLTNVCSTLLAKSTWGRLYIYARSQYNDDNHTDTIYWFARQSKRKESAS